MSTRSLRHTSQEAKRAQDERQGAGRGGGQKAVGTLDAEQQAEAEPPSSATASGRMRGRYGATPDDRFVAALSTVASTKRTGEIPNADRNDADAGQERRGDGEPYDARGTPMRRRRSRADRRLEDNWSPRPRSSRAAMSRDK